MTRRLIWVVSDYIRRKVYMSILNAEVEELEPGGGNNLVSDAVFDISTD